MSRAASWSYTAPVTLWPVIARGSSWDGAAQYGAPILLAADYKYTTKQMVTADGTPFTSSAKVYTEFATAKAGDRVAIGDHTTQLEPVSTSGIVRVVERYADTLERVADDFVLVT